MDGDDIRRTTRRAIIKTTAAGLGLAAAGSASAHEWGTSSSTTADISGGSPTATDAPGGWKQGEPVGYHSLGGVGSESTAGRPSSPHYGGRTEIRTHGDHAYVSFFSSDDPTPGRGMAIVDISDYNRATSQSALERAEMSVLSILPNNSTGTAVMDLKVSDDGDYVFLGTQPYTALFGEEAYDPTPNTNDYTGTESPGAVVAVDVSDKGNPETVGVFEVSGTGVHNCYHHRIGNEEYVFAIHDLNDGTEGIYVLNFDRATGGLSLVNRWTLDGDLAQYETGTSMRYIHDLEIVDDPVTGRPTAYLGYWDEGLFVLDVSDPENLVERGHFDMNACHFTTVPGALVDGRRLCIASQETPASSTRSGTVHLLDASGLYEEPGVAEIEELDVWEWLNETDDNAQHTDVDVEFGNFELSPHNSSLDRHGDEWWLHQCHYYGGVRYLRVDTETGSFEDRGFSRPQYDTPEESRMTGLTDVTPNCWAAVASNGVTFASDINQGVHAIHHRDVELGDAPPTFAAATRQDDGSLFTGGQTNQVDIDLSFAPGRADAEPVRVRDRLPAGWNVVGGDAERVVEAGGSTFAEFASAGDGATLTYFAEAPEGLDTVGEATFGPVGVSTDGGETWFALADTIERNTSGGISTALIGTGAVGVGAVTLATDGLLDRFRSEE